MLSELASTLTTWCKSMLCPLGSDGCPFCKNCKEVTRIDWEDALNDNLRIIGSLKENGWDID